MPTFNELTREAREQIIRRKQKNITAFLADIETRVAANPELEEVLLELAKVLIARNGHTPVVAPAPPKPKHMFAAGTEAGVESYRDQLQNWFGLSDLEKLMEAASFPFNSSDHRKAIRDALYRLEKNKRRVKSQKGEDGKTQYKFI